MGLKTDLAVSALLTAVLPGTLFAAEIDVSMQDLAYVPAKLTASIGDKIRFINKDQAAHNVFIATAQFAADLGKQENGSEIVFVPGRTGTFEIECVFHSHMLTIVEVK